MSQTASRFRALLALGVVLVPLLLAGATLAHTHDGAGIGLYNHDHDLVLMGALGSVAPLPAIVVAVAVVVVTFLICAPALAIDSSARRLEVSRAPPSA
jgi:preprotein translocase subunit SecG